MFSYFVDIAKVITLCCLIDSLLTTDNKIDLKLEEAKIKIMLATTFVFCYVWSIGGNIVSKDWDQFDTFVRQQFDEDADAKLGQGGDLFSYEVDVHHRRMETWEKSVPTFKYDKTKPFFDLLVPNIDSCRFGYLLEKFVSVNKSVLFTGETGVGKTVIARAQLLKLAEEQNIVPLFLNFSAQTSSKRTQEMIVPKLEKRKKNAFGPPRGKRMVILIDDLNMPKLETYGAQPPIELLRQYQDFGGLYDRETLKWIDIQDVILCAACGPPGGGRNATTARLLRHFAIFAIPAPSEYSLKHIFKSILNGYLADFNQSTKTAGDSIIDAAVEIYLRMSAELLPTPTKSHYVFNLRDLSKCIQGILQVKPESVSDRDSLVRVFFHESMRVFHDRLINDEDKQYFHTMLSELSTRLFAIQIEATTFVQKPIVFGDFMKVGAPKNERLYEEITDMTKIRNVLQDYQEDYNLTNNKNTRLVFFMDAIEHIARIVRIIRQDRGNALLVGVGGTGKQSLTRLASHICGYKCFQIELSRGYNYDTFHEDLKKLYEQAGPNNQNTVFLFTDNQIVVEEFLEDVNNILNSGEVPNLFDKQDEREKMIIGCRPGAKDAGIAENDRDGIYTFFINRVRNNLHLVLCMSPVGSSFRTRCRMFPSLVNCCTIDWFSEWPREALLSVAHTSFEKYPWPKGEEFMVKALAQMCVEIHMSVSTKAKQLLAELRRYYYTTPTSYLELINLYLMMLNDKKKEIDNARARVERGLKKLEETNILVDDMQLELVALEPQLKKKSDETAKLMETLAIDQEKADEVRRVVMEDEAVARVKAEETQAMKDDAQRDLNQALPAVEKANEAIGRLKKESIGEVRTFTKPPHMVEVVMQAVCIMFEKKKDWPSAKLLLGESDFINQIRNYPKDSIPESILRDLKPYLQMSNFNYKDILQSSVACASLAEWVIAMDMYAKISREVEPKRKRVAAAEADLRAVTDQLKKKQQQLQQVEAKIKELQESYDHQVAEKKKLEISIMQTQSRLKRASKLTTALADEQVRWKENITEFNEQMKTVTGNVFVSSACVAYYGAFPSSYRQELVEDWVNGCKEHKIPVSDNPSIINVLADAFSIRQWVTQGLPRDDFSTENAILVTKGRRWPLIIDPQEQANRWIKNKEKENALKVIKMTDGHFLRILENCVRIGMPLLLEDVGETLDPALEPILLKQTFMSGGRLLIRLGDSDIEYDSNFKFYMTTKLSNPHYLPEICIKVTIINFSVTKQGLEDQILSDVVRLERPDLDEEMNRLIVTMNNDRNQLKAIEDKILKMLFESEGNILDNEELVNSLNDSKVTSSAIKRRLEETIKTEANISAAREKYRRAAKRGSLLYFVVADLGLIDPMYQFSLRYFTLLFNATIENSTKSEDLNQRLQIILDSTTENIYTNVSRGLFEKDKLVFSFLLCAEILKLEGTINEVEWNFLLRGGLITDEKRPPKPNHDWLIIEHWNQALLLVGVSDVFKNLPRDIEQYQQPIYVQINPELRVAINSNDMTTNVPSEYNTKLSDFQKLLFVKAFAPYLLVQCITYFVAEQLGKKFVESPSVELPILYQDMSNRIALVFILSTGSDPMSSFTRFAAEMNMSTSYKAISLGQGQGPVAEDMISKSVVAGEWIFLQNCHLAASWMINMESIVKNINEGVTPCHNNFRLFLSSMPAKTFPVSVLQNSVKVTSEPPKGIRANIKRAFTDITSTFFETHRLEMDWKKIVFGICFFHAILLERKKFGPLGFNIRYEFNDSDRECALLNFDMFCKEGAIPWDALIYITGEITYGGRVTDFWDQRCLRTILRRFFSPETLSSDYKYSPSGTYYCPERKFLQQYRDYIEELPLNDNPEIFGMNSNANITFQTQESNYLVNTIIDIQPRVSSGGAGKSNDEIVYELAEAILAKLPEKLDIEKAPRSLFEPDAKDRLNSLTTVLQQEVDRYNRLLNIIKLSLSNQMKAIKGLVVMDDTLEKMYTAFLNNQVPAIWADAAYPSLKSLASWIKDLLLRCDFVALWITHGLPKSYWLPGLFFPQGFLTGVLQVHARKYDLPIDELSFHFTILPFERDHASYNEQAKRLEYGKKLDVDEQLPHVKDGVILHGLYMEAFRWDSERKQITDAARGEMIATLPMLHMEPRQNYVVDPTHYISPLYKTAARAGVLSTTGHSTNFVVTVNLPTDKPQDYWISMGSALLCQETEPLSSDDENTSRNITFERVMKECGSFGRYQYIHFFFIVFFPIATGINNFYYVFGAAETPYECIIPNNTHHGFYIEVASSQCFYIIKNDQNITNGTYPCTNWKYDRRLFGKTFSEEANFICQHSIHRSLLAIMLQVGAMLVFFTGQITDLIGRRRTMQLLIGLLLITSLITQGLLQFLPMSINLKFILLLINQFVAGIDTFMVSFILLMELTTSSYTTFVGNLALVAFTFGEIIVTGMAYVCRHWLLLKWAMTLYVLALVPYLFFIPESPHWLLTQQRYDELKELLYQIARFNQRSESQWLPYYRYVIEKYKKQKDLNQKMKITLSTFSKLRRFLTHAPTISKFLISGYFGFITLFLYYKISYGLGAMTEIDPYSNIIIGAIVEALGYIVPSLLMIRYGRKPIFILFLILTIICLLLRALTFIQKPFIIIIIAQLGKFAISAATGVTYIFVPELFPTTIRGTGMGVFAFFGRLGSTIAPLIDASISHNPTLIINMYYLYTVLTIIGVLLTFLLPETRNVPLVDKINYNSINQNNKKPSNAPSIART
ncbi:unnamed protein product [Rotaria sp. Silwood1]|nr:unnamed protein product [Rotaria sp. Silwood1]